MKKFILAGYLCFLCLPALAANDYSKDAESYAQRNNVSLSEAERALNIEMHKDELLKIIEDEYKGRIAGIYIENSPEYTIVVRLKGNGANSKRELSIKNALPGVEVPVRFEYGAKETKEAAKGQVQKAQRLAEKYFDTVQIVSYNERTGNIDVEINSKSSPEVSSKMSKIQEEWKNPKIPLNVELVSYSISPMGLAYGGTPVIDKSLVGSTGLAYRCTTGFGVKDSAGRKYMSTAAHCRDNFEDKYTGAKYYFVDEIPYAESNDLQWNSTTETITNQFRDGVNSTRTLSGRRTLRYTNAGDQVCHYGSSTGFSCGVVQAVGVSISSIDPVNGWKFPGNFWVKVRTSDPKDCAPGDSGGPVFTGRTLASGIVSLDLTEDYDDNDPTNDACIGYLYLPTDKVYESGLSFVY